MATAETQKEYNTFVRGLITEASPLTYPENASIDEDNFVLKKDGSRLRRLGIDYENSYTISDTGIVDSTFTNYAISSFRWDNVNNDPTLSIGVIQAGPRLWFVDLYTAAPSSNLLNGGTYFTIPTVSGNSALQYATINGNLVITSGETDPLKIEYDSLGDSISSSSIILEVRDIWGLDDSLAVDENPDSLSDTHHYNLLNQGWEEDKINDFVGAAGGGSSSIKLWAASTTYNKDSVRQPTSPNQYRYKVTVAGQSAASEPTWPTVIGSSVTDGTVTWVNEGPAGIYPSNAQIWWAGKDTDNDFSPAELAKIGFGTTPAPKGHYTLRYSEVRGSDRVDAVLDGTGYTLTLPSDSETSHFKAIASFAGRVWYAGLDSEILDGDENSPSSNGMILFSQLAVDKDASIGLCYQKSDPTAEDSNELVDTDGGFINIPEASVIWKMIELNGTLIVIAENGIWQVRGGDRGFTATEYSVNKVANIGAVNQESIVFAENNIFYWSKGGIYLLSVDPQNGNLLVDNLTETTIQTYYNGISGTAKSFSVGDYDEAAKTVSWLYNDTDSYDGIVLPYKYNRELIIDTTLQSVYLNSIADTSTNTPFIAGYLSTPSFLATSYQDSVVVDSDPVVVNGDQVIVTKDIRSIGVSDRKYLTFITPDTGSNYSFTLSQFNNGDFVDWEASDTVGVDYSSYMVTGYELLGDTARDKQGRYLTMHFSRTEESFIDDGSGSIVFDDPSSCLVQTRWEWSDSSNGRYGPQFQAYRFIRPYISGGIGSTFDYGFEVISTKSKIRGKGKALSFRIESETGKNMHLLGWSVSYTGTTRV